ncbi:MAG: carbohydrate binding domain-containing protein [Patescibacteria group bacterium]
MKRFSISLWLVAVALLLSVSQGSAAPAFKLPFSVSETWWVTQGNNQGGHTSDVLKYGWDFNSNNDPGRPVLTSVAGTVVAVSNDGSYNSGWGNTVVVKHSDGFYSRVAHLEDVLVVIDQEVPQGYILGTCGTTGRSTGAHIHYQVQGSVSGNSIPSSFVDVPNGGVPTGCDCSEDDGAHRYVSGNTPHGPGFFPDGWDEEISPAFLDVYLDAGGYAKLGLPSNNGGGEYVHDWYGVWLQDLQGLYYGTDGQTALVWSPEEKKAFLIKEGFWCVYKGASPYTCYSASPSLFGPIDLGPPISNEVACPDGGTCQYFELGKLRYASPIEVFFGDFRAEMEEQEEVPPVALTCVDRIQARDWGWENFYAGALLNGRSDICGAWGWQTYYCDTGGPRLAASCNDDLRPDNCAIGSGTTKLGTQVSRYHAQLTNHEDWPLQIEANAIYYWEAEARTTSGVAERNVTIALTPRRTYDHYGYIISLGDVLAPEQTFQINRQWQQFSGYFTTRRSDSTAAIRFFYGDAVGDLSFDNLYFEIVGIVPSPTINLLRNPSFESGATSWAFRSAGGTQGTGTGQVTTIGAVDGRRAYQVLVSKSGAISGVQLYQTQSLQAGQVYELIFWAKGSAYQTPKVTVIQNHSPGQNLDSGYTFALMPEWHRYRYRFSPAQTDTNAKLVFYLSGQTGTYYFDGLHLSVIDEPLDDPNNLLGNGGAEIGGLYPWQVEDHNNTVEISQDCSSAFSGDCSWWLSNATANQYAWQGQFKQSLSVQVGWQCQLSYAAAASNSLPLIISLEQDHSPYQGLGLWQSVNLSSGWQTYSHDFTVLGDDASAKLTFEFGDQAADFWLDAIVLTCEE